MSGARRIGIVEDPRFAEHREPPGHPERAERLEAVTEAVDAVRGQLRALPARRAEPEEILAVHEDGHLRRIEATAGAGPGRLDADTFVSSESYEVALLAAGAAVDLVRAVARGDLDGGLAAVRPPGHHAEHDQAMGFCLFNNVAVAARAARSEGIERVMILDWDVHHGNGTQHSFETDPHVLYASTHQYPFYPGTGDFGEVGIGRGEGTTLNLPLPAGSGDAELIGALQHVVSPVARSFRPELILISAGFDAHREDPLAALNVSGPGFLAMTRVMRSLADDLCGGRIAFVLEGGYALRGLREGVGAALEGLLEPATPPVPETPLPEGSVLAQVVARAAACHARSAPELAARR